MNRFRLCVCYLLSTILISAFVYTMISGNMSNSRKLERLQQEMDEMANMMLGNVASKGESRHLTDLIDNIIKKRLTGIWDDLFTIKKQLKEKECSSLTMGAFSKYTRDSSAVAKLDERVNYASEALGAKIVCVKAEPLCPANYIKSFFGMQYGANAPAHILRPSMEPGNCFAFKKDKAEVTIELPHGILIDQIAIQHIAKNKSPTDNTSSAPKDFSVYGVKPEKQLLLGKFRYDNIKPFQLFPIKTMDKHKLLRFQFDSNHGHLNYTCIYRVAVYGKL